MTQQADIFELAVPREKLAFTNGLWNTMKLNSPWIIGRVTSIILDQDFASKEDWRDYYFQSGQTRQAQLQELSVADRARLTSIELWNFYQGSTKTVNQLNEQFGRTQDELNSLGDVLYGALRAGDNPLNITKKECRYLVMYRVIGETWNGLIMREKNTIHTLNTHLPDGYTVEKIDSEKDVRYEVDAEVSFNGTLIAGIQIKPKSYQSGFQNNQATYDLNHQKNTAYTSLTAVPVLYVYSDHKGTIHNTEVFTTLINLTLKETTPS